MTTNNNLDALFADAEIPFGHSGRRLDDTPEHFDHRDDRYEPPPVDPPEEGRVVNRFTARTIGAVMSNSEDQGEIAITWGEDMAFQRTIETAIRLVEQKRDELIEQAKISEQDAVEVLEQLDNANLVWRLLTRAANVATDL